MSDQTEYAKELAIKNMRVGVIAGMVVFGVSLGQYVIVNFLNPSHAGFDATKDPLAIVDLILVFLLIWGITRHSRFAAIGLFLYYLLNKIIQFLDVGSIWVIALSLFFLFFFARAIKGTFDYHSLMKQENVEYKPTKKWMWWVGIPISVILIFLFTVGTLSHFEVTPATYVKSSQDITTKDLQALQEIGLINADTRVTAFYSDGLFSRKESGVFMTNQELVIYAEYEGQLYFDRLRYEQIDWVKQLSQGSDFEDAVYQVAGRDRYQGFQFALSTENNGHQVFFQNLKNKTSAPLPKIEIPLPTIDIGKN